MLIGRRRFKSVFVILIVSVIVLRLLLRQPRRTPLHFNNVVVSSTATNSTLSTLVPDGRCSTEHDDVLSTRHPFDELDEFRLDLVYRKFVPRPPRFVDVADRTTFDSNAVNRRYLRVPSQRELVGKVCMTSSCI